MEVSAFSKMSKDKVYYKNRLINNCTKDSMLTKKNLKLNDKIIRAKLLDNFYYGISSNKTIIVEELDLCVGEARIDLAIIDDNGIKGIEIKSDKDNLNRLEKQITTYNKVFDTIEIVVGITHLEKIRKEVPAWWGISVVTATNQGTFNFKKIRNSRINTKKDPLSVIQLLWKDEALQLLGKKNLSHSYKHKSRDIIWHKLLSFFEKEELYGYVNECLCSRSNWRFVHQLA